MKKLTFMLFALLLMAAACKEKENSLALLRANKWTLKTMTLEGTEKTNPEELPVLEFSDSTAVYGSAGCNRFFGFYKVDGEKLTLRPEGATMMACPDLEFEDAYLKALEEVENYAIMEGELKLSGRKGFLMLVYVKSEE